MNVAEYLIKKIKDEGVTDVFGIPGGVVLDFLYAVDQEDGITPHLNFHEQCAGFAASGYAQAKGRLGVAYATRGPGVSNLMTAIADSFYESTPVLFISAHSSSQTLPDGMRILNDQDFDFSTELKSITKYSARIDDISSVKVNIDMAITAALADRNGPVFLDFLSSLWNKELESDSEASSKVECHKNDVEGIKEAASEIIDEIKNSSRPVILIGDGIHQSGMVEQCISLAEKISVPVLSSRYAADVINESAGYYGYIGSHGIRYANFILSKADLILSLGNRLAFPVDSNSYKAVYKNTKILRIEVDEAEYQRKIPNCINYRFNLHDMLPGLINEADNIKRKEKWISVCDSIRVELEDSDTNDAVFGINQVLNFIPDNAAIVSDVGNQEFWLSRAYVRSRINNRVLYSKSFGALGNSIGKSIGVYYSMHSPVLCVAGDQGFQLNVQELQFLAQNNIPIVILLINNCSSGMIRQRENNKFSYLLHTTLKDGYSEPNFKSIATAYGIEYYEFPKDINKVDWEKPGLFEMKVDERLELTPSLPKGRSIQDMYPDLARDTYEYLSNI